MEAEKIDVGWIDPGFVSPHFTHSIAHTLRDMEYFGCAGRVFRQSSSLPVLSRNHLIIEFLGESDSPWLWLVDDDMKFDRGHPMKLWETANEYEVDMVSGLAFIWHHSQPLPKPSVFVEGGGAAGGEKGDLMQLLNRVPDGPCPIAASGLASALIHRRVFEAMQPERFEEYRWFDIGRTNSQGIPLGEDLQFFQRARELGFELMLNPDAETWHVKEVGIGRDDFDRALKVHEAATT